MSEPFTPEPEERLPPRRRRRGLVLAVLVLLVAVAGTWWLVRRFQNPNRSDLIEAMSMDMKEMHATQGAVPVAVETLQRRDISQRLEYTGTVTAYEEPVISPRVAGRLAQVLVYPGQQVAAGQVLARLEAQELDARVEQARQQQAMAQQQQQIAQHQARQVEAGDRALQARIAKARQETKVSEAAYRFQQGVLVREEHLYQAGAISREEWDRAQADLTTAQARLAASHREVEGLLREREAQQAAIGEARHRIQFSRSDARKSQAALQEQRIIAGYQQILAQQAAIVTERLASPGTYVMAGTPLLKLAAIDRVRIQIPVSEKDLKDLHIGSRLTFHSAARPSDAIEAKVTSLFPSADLRSRTHIVEAVVPNFDRELLPGQYIKASLEADQAQQVPALPTRALFQLAGEDKVWVVRNGRATMVSVEVGAQGEDWSAVEGLPAGTEVITAGYQNLQEGQSVVSVPWGESGPESLPPPQGTGLRLDKANRWTVSEEREPYRLSISLQPQPPAAGEQTLRFELKDKQGQPIRQAQFELKTAMPAMNMGGPTLKATETEPGIYQAKLTTMSGLWQIELAFSWPGQPVQSLTFEYVAQ